jgi:two-component system chemotaxis response regulator CheY
MNILIVDDSNIIRKLVVNRVPQKIKENASFIHGVNGQEAVDLYKKHRPDIVFLDLTMPVMDGYEALDQIMAFDKDACVYVITADIQKKAKERVLASGAVALETKPIDEERLAKIFSCIKQD